MVLLKPRSLILAGIVIALMVFPSLPAGWAKEETSCAGGFAGRITSGTFENVVVPEGAACFIFGSVRIDNITVEQKAELHIFGGVVVAGNLHSAGADHVVINPSRGGRNAVAGNVEIKDSIHVTTLSALAVGGNVELQGNVGLVTVTSDSVGGNVRVDDSQGGASIDQNVVLGNLQCKDNSSPFTLGTNYVVGNSEGQCA